MYQMMNGGMSKDRNCRRMPASMGGNTGDIGQNDQPAEWGGWGGGNDRPGMMEPPMGMQGNMGGMTGNMPGNMDGMTGNMSGNMSGMTGGMAGNMPAGNMGHTVHTSTPEEGRMRTLNLDTGLSQDAIDNPTSLLEARLGSLRSLLGNLVGHYIIATFLIGTQNPVSWEGFLYSVGNDYIVMFQPDMGRYVTGDMYSLKFVEFYEEKGVIPFCAGYRRRDSQSMW